MTSVLSEAAEGAPRGAPSREVFLFDEFSSSFGPCYQAISTLDEKGVYIHGECVQVVIAIDGNPIEPLPAGVERAKFIVKACNAHHDLVAALLAAHLHMKSTGCHHSYLEQQEAALKNAGVEP